MKDKIKVALGAAIIDGVRWSLFCRDYPNEVSKFRNDDDQVLEIKDEILDFEKREITSKGVNNIMNQRKGKK